MARLSRMAPTQAACIFCGQTDGQLTYEDVYPKWIRKVLGIKGKRVTLEQGGLSRRPVRVTRNLTVRLGGVCAGCNNGWMSRLETSTRKVMAPAMQGREVHLSSGDQALVALWATKMALLLERSMIDIRGRGFAPASHFKWLHDNHSPPPTTRVWIGAVRDFGDHPAWGHTATMQHGAEISEGYLAAFTVGHVLFQVLGIENLTVRPVGDGPIALPLRDGRYLVPIWPDLLPEVIWPPPSVFANVDALDSVWRSA